MQELITIEDVGNAFWNWQSWWIVAKSTGDIEDLRAMTIAGLEYNKLSEEYANQKESIDLSEKELFDSFAERYQEFVREEDGKFEAER